MCTVTYLPLNDGYILTSNRDEMIARADVSFPVEISHEQSTICFPKDNTGGGTWIASDDSGRSACLLNGAFLAHTRQPPYKKSRGLVLLDALAASNWKIWIRSIDLLGIEPFTLLLFDRESKITELRWDGVRKYIIGKSAAEPYIWASATLYSDKYIELRKEWFSDWLNINGPYLVESIRDFHKTGGNDDKENTINMSRDGFLQTISVTTVEVSNDKGKIIYESFIDKSIKEKHIKLKRYALD